MTEQRRKLRTLSWSIMVILLGTSLLFLFLLNALRIGFQLKEEAENIESVAMRLEQERRLAVQSLVDGTLTTLQTRRQKMDHQTREMIKSRTKIAAGLVRSLYATRGNESPDRTQHRVREALRTVRFENGRDYFFAEDLKGFTQLSPIAPQLEGTDLLANPQYKDVQASIIDTVRAAGEGFVSYSWAYPGKEDAGPSPKIAYVELVKEFGWIVGTGIYLEDAEREEERALLDYIARLGHPAASDLFVIAWDGTAISGPLAGTNLIDAKDANGQAFIREAIALARKQGGFLEYDLTGLERFPVRDSRLAYVRGDPKRQWLIGVSTSKTLLESDTRKLQEVIKANANQTIKAVLASLLLSSLVVVVLGAYLRRLLQRNFADFRNYLTALIETGEGGTASTPPFAEFAELGDTMRGVVAERRSVENRLAESEKRSRLILATVSDGIVGIDRRGEPEYANAAALAMLGYPSLEEAGQQGRATLLPAGLDIDTLFAAGGRVTPPGTPAPGSTQRSICHRRDGSTLHVEYECTLAFEAGEMVGLVVTFRDIEARQRVEQEQARARRLAEEATRAKSDFLANMSHEIRTPMNAVIGMTHLALESGLSGRPRNFVEKANMAAQNLLGIINDILDFSKIEADKMTLEAIDFRLEDVIEHVESLVITSIDAKRLTWQAEIDSAVPTSLRGDPLRLGQVLANLTSNAVKFTEQGNITLTVALAARSADRAELHVSVRDTGIGLSAEQISRLFQSFSQADMSTTRDYGGTGLGLAICKRLVELMHGQIWVESTPGTGATFHFTGSFGLPAASVARHQERSGAAGEAETNRARAQLAGARILLVDDNDMNLELASELLQAAGIEVVVARNGREALDRLGADAAFDGVLMDCQMPVLDGYAASAEIRRHPEWSGLPVLAMTASASEDDRQKALAAGMNEHIAKPLLVAPLFQTMARWISPTRPATTPPSLRPDEAEAFGALSGVDTQQGMTITQGNAALYRRFLAQFGRAWADFAGQFAKARSAEDAQAAMRLAHTLKGSAANIGAHAVQRAAGRLDSACQRRDEAATADGLAETVAALAEVLPGLQQFDDGPAPPERAETSVADVGTLRARIGRLGELVEQCDGAALDLAEELHQQLAGMSCAAAMHEVKSALDAIDFDRAEAALGLLMREFDATQAPGQAAAGHDDGE